MKSFFIGEMIRQRRMELGLKQNELCQGICEPTTMCRIESGKQTPSLNQLKVLLQRLGLPDERYYAIVSKNEMLISDLQTEIVSSNVFRDPQRGLPKIEELEKIAGKYGYTLDSESLEIIQEYVQKYKKYENHFWEYGKKIITFEQFSRMLSKKAGIQPKEAKEYVVANLQNLEHKEILEALLFSLQLIKSEKGLEGTQWTKPTCDFIKKEFEKMIVNEEY